jgi:Leucine-rich repeat (LRR) protein
VTETQLTQALELHVDEEQFEEGIEIKNEEINYIS